MRCCVVFCFLFVCVEYGLVDGLKASEKGVCVSKHSVVKTRPKTVLVALSKWCGKKKCTVKQTRQQKYTVITNSFVCCKGFVYIAGSDVCEPVCSTGCLNGTCTDPDVCQCTAPLYLDPTTKNKCLSPTCDTCVNSYCTVNNTCICDKDFVYFNATHCAPNCTDGFELNSSLICVPKCENCVHGKCVAPDTCICDLGYVNATCQPHCDSCNGRCTSPNTCECFDGYESNGTYCVPKCDSCDGVCVSPNVCECNEGYLNVNGSCVPVCKEPCVNGWCSAPDVCSCDEGATRKNATVCQRRCGECRANGTCLAMASVPKTRLISYQATIKCKDGKGRCTKMMTKSERYIDKQPVEICCDNYLFVEQNGTESCIPECEDECEGGTCVAPNVCVCEAPLVLHNATAPHKCLPPVCEKPCVNGVCTSNNQCTCSEGYTLKDNFTCVAQCTNCTNGECISPNLCMCHDGYSMENGTCTPQCNCSHGFCLAPNICTCDAGYELKNNNCEPVCEKPCVNGKCVSPNTCECFEGYESNGEDTCTPKCESCRHGVCSAPGVCECHKGYTLSDKDCVPKCDEPCIHGYCSAPNECSCEDGYTQDVLNSTVCRKPCSLCIGGDCSLEGECICPPEMDLSNGTCELTTPGETSGITGSTTTGLASLQMTWWVGGAVGLLLMVLVLVAISRIWHTRKDFVQKSPDNGPFGSVAYTLPNTLVRGPNDPDDPDDETSDELLTKGTSVV